MKISTASLLLSLCFFGTISSSQSAFAETLTWTLSDVVFTNGVTAYGSFNYNADTNVVSNINILSAGVTYSKLDPAFPVRPFELAFLPNVPIVYGSKIPALFFTPAPVLTDAGGTVALYGTVDGYFHISNRGEECDDACDGINLGQQIESGTLTASQPSPVPEPNFALLDAFSGLALAGVTTLRRRQPRKSEL